jgi:hypothetical protein
VGPAGSDRVSRARPYSGTSQGSARAFAYGAFTLFGASFHPLPLTHAFLTPRPRCGTIKQRPTTPHRQRPQAIAPTRFGLFPFRSPLLRESRFLSFPRATKMFQFARLPPLHLWIQCRVPALSHGWVSPFGNPRINACSAAPRGLSQPSTSFIGSWCQGIHRVPLFSCFLAVRSSREHQLPLCSFQGTRGLLARPPERRPARLPEEDERAARARTLTSSAPVSQNSTA